MNTRINELRKHKETAARRDILEIVPINHLFGTPISLSLLAIVCGMMHFFLPSLPPYTEEQFYRFLSHSNERIVKYRMKMILLLENYFKKPEVNNKIQDL